MKELAELQQFCEGHGLPWTAEAAERFETFVDLLEQFNAKMNLIGPFERIEIVRQMFIDSIVAAVLVPPSGSVLDIGTGAGFPGIPLKILYPDVPFTLVEPRQKRAMFLKIARTRLKLDDVEIINERIEDGALDQHEWLVSKAFRNPPEWVKIAAPLTAGGGYVVCLHAADASEELADAAKALDLELVGRIDDVADELEASLPPGRATSVFRR